MGGHHFVLVHGMGHGAWCWFKVTALLQSRGHTVTALDLASSGINNIVADTVTSVAGYLAPLTHFLAHSVINQKVILVGHSMGGSSISYAMELFPEKVSKAIFISGFMPLSGSFFLPGQKSAGGRGRWWHPVLAGQIVFETPQKLLTATIDAQAVLLVNGSSNDKESSRPTSIYIDVMEASKFLYNKCSLEDVTLAYACLSPSPFVLTEEILSLSSNAYGSIPRFYITCLEDLALPLSTQHLIIQQNPPLDVFTIPHSDHSPFFSQPTTLVDHLISIALF